MTLDEYLSTHPISETAFGVEIGLSQSQVNRLRNNKSWPGREVMARIRDASEGLVTANDFIPPREAAPAQTGEAA